MEYRENRLIKLKEDLVNNCKECNGTGYIKENIKCKCLLLFEKYVHYDFAGIEKEYWNVSMKDWYGDSLAKKYVKQYLKHLEEVWSGGLGFIFLGKNGVGKTMLSNIILKKAFNSGYTIRNITLAELLKLIKSTFDDKNKIPEYEKIKQVDFLCLDNVGSEYKPKDFGAFTIAELDILIRFRTNNKLPTMITSNIENENEFKKQYGSSILSLLNSITKIVVVQGEDYRLKQGKDWEKKLMGNKDE